MTYNARVSCCAVAVGAEHCRVLLHCDPCQSLTISNIAQGFGDISPKSSVARVVIMLVLLGSFVMIPYEVTKLVEAFHRMPKHRVGYKLVGKKLHVVLAVAAGDCLITVLCVMFCKYAQVVFSAFSSL
jgi:hypothetical protein